MSKLTFNAIGVAILATLLALNAVSMIELGAMIWLVAALAIGGAFNVINARREQGQTNG